MVNQLSVLHGIVNDDTFISQITSSAINTGANIVKRFAAGHEHPLAVYNLNQALSATFSTTQLKTILDLTGAGIANLSAEDTILYYKVMENYASRQGNSEEVHFSYTAADAVLVPQSITASQDADLAEVSCMLHFPYDGSNEPLVPAGTAAVSGTSSHLQAYGLGPIAVNASAINGVQSVTIDFGITSKVRSSDGDMYPSLVAMESAAPVITFQCYRQALQTFGINGTGLTALSVYLRAKTATGNVADATASHIKFAATAGAIYIDDVSGGNNDDSITTVRCELVAANSSTAPMTITTATAIT